MNSSYRREPVLTELDHVRLSALLRRSETPKDDDVEELLDQAIITPSRLVGADVVTMYSRLRLIDAQGRSRTIVICWPKDAKAEAGYVSVLSPLGTALLGRKVGDQIRWSGADGSSHAAEISAVLFQPEASGDYTT